MTGKRLPPGPHLDLLLEALDTEAGAQRALLDGDPAGAARMFDAASRRYRASYECAPPESYGRLVGMLKAAVIAGDPADAVGFARRALVDAQPTPTAGYATAIAALVAGDIDATRRGTALMRAGDERFVRTAAAITALVEGDRVAYEHACRAIVADFEASAEHVTGVAIADTAVMLETIAADHGLACHPVSALMPATP